MILIHHSADGGRRTVDLNGTFRGRTAMLVGGAPSLREQPIELLNERGVLAMAMNNAAIHFRPTLWVSGDNPACYEPQILRDPRITKFAPLSQAMQPVLGGRYHEITNIYFYLQEANIPWEEYLAPRRGVPWYSNTLFVGIHILFQLGVQRIILAGSDFGFAKNGAMYAHGTSFGSLEKKWNLDLYNHQAKELRMLKPIFEKAGLQLLDASKNSRLKQVYEHITLEKAIELCLEDFPEEMVDPATLPHCSKFAPMHIKKAIAGWPGHRGTQPVPQQAELPQKPTLDDEDLQSVV